MVGDVCADEGPCCVEGQDSCGAGMRPSDVFICLCGWLRVMPRWHTSASYFSDTFARKRGPPRRHGGVIDAFLASLGRVGVSVCDVELCVEGVVQEEEEIEIEFVRETEQDGSMKAAAWWCTL